MNSQIEPATRLKRKTDLPGVEVGMRFVVEDWQGLPPVELVKKLPTSWLVAEINPDGTLARGGYRLAKSGLSGRMVRILPIGFKPKPSSEAGPPKLHPPHIAES